MKDESIKMERNYLMQRYQQGESLSAEEYKFLVDTSDFIN